MSETKPSGCLLLGGLVRLLTGGSSPAASSLPPPSVMVSNKFFSEAEINFYRVLQQCVGEELTVLTQVSLRQLFFFKSKVQGRQIWVNKTQNRSVDFLLCDPRTLRPRVAIELDDASHQRPDRIARDAEVDTLFAAAGLPLLHIKAARQYDTRALVKEIQQAQSETRL